MDTMRMNHSIAGECLIVDEEPIIDATKFFYLLKDFDESLYGCTNHSYQLWHKRSPSSQIMS